MRRILLLQGAYFLVTGLWPLAHLRSFLAVTGEKRDIWLLKTVSVLIVAIGAALLAASRRREPSGEAVLLAVGSAAGLAGIDVYYAARRVIRPVYLLDAAVECALIAWLLLASRGVRREA
jgi:hypothetical protein